ncbi:hypothetical protein [Oculatella sp. LEGE 06141]|nr:hypothetical protein [Oculatella sp. LEGE 06141]
MVATVPEGNGGNRLVKAIDETLQVKRLGAIDAADCPIPLC